MTALLALLIRSRRIVRINLATGAVDTVTEDTGPAPDGIVVVDRTLYWSTMGKPTVAPDGNRETRLDYSATDGGLYRCAIDGSARADVLPAGSLTTGKQLTTDGTGVLYWGDREGCRVSRVRLDGTGLEDVVAFSRSGGVVNECVGVAIDNARGHVYWTQKGPPNGGQGRILRAGITMPNGETAWNRTDIETVWEALPEPIDLEICDDLLYWTDRGTSEDGGNTLNRAPIPGPGISGDEPEILASGFREAIGLAIDADARVAYVSDLGGEIREVPLPGGSERDERVLVAFGEPLTGLALWRSDKVVGR